jgi:nitrogen fixation protein NifZ
MSRPAYDYGAAVRVIRNVRNDGTYPGMKTGDFLVRRGSVGYVRDVGTFLQDQLIYTVHFMDEGRMVGCREEELIPEEAPWIPSRYEFREKVRATKELARQGEVLVPRGSEGQIIKVLRAGEHGVIYHVLFGTRLLAVPEHALGEPMP